MPTIRLIPSTYQLSSTSYLKITNPTNMYTNTDSTTYATVSNSRAATTAYYLYIKGFNFSAIPSNATVSSFTVKLKIRETGGTTTSSSTYLTLSNNTTAINGTPSSGMGTTDKVITFTTTVAWDTIKGYGANFGIRVNCRRNNKNTTAYFYISGAEILVNYTLPTFGVVSILNAPSGSTAYMQPSGTTQVVGGQPYTLVITPGNKDDEVTLKDNNAYKPLVSHTIPSSGTASFIVSRYTLQSGTVTNEQYISDAVGNGYDTPNATYFQANPTSLIARYDFDVGGIPSNATITGIRCKVKGHAEIDSTYMKVSLVNGSTTISPIVAFPDDNMVGAVVTVTASSYPSVSQLNNIWLCLDVARKGCAVDGITLEIDFTSTSGPGIYYTYSLASVTAVHTLEVTVTPLVKQMVYFKDGGNWVSASRVYKKVSGVWVLQPDLSTVFDSTVVYLKG